MNRMIDPRKVQEALDSAARSGDRSGRFTLNGQDDAARGLVEGQGQALQQTGQVPVVGRQARPGLSAAMNAKVKIEVW